MKDEDKDIYRESSKRTNHLINRSRAERYFKKIESCDSPKLKCKAVKNILHPPSNNPNRTPEEAIQISITLADFFREKMKKIMTSIQERLIGVIPDPMRNDEIHAGKRLHVLKEVTETEVEKLLSAMSGKSSRMDFVPTSLLNECRKTFSIINARLANLSFSEGRFPSRFKAAQITPLLKKEGLDQKILGNYRPISNLNTVSKILERLFSTRLTPHVPPACCPLQSAYRRHHSTETALLRITNDMFEAAELGLATVLVALDLSAAFDTINHAVLVQRLTDTFGVSGPAINWIKS